MGAAYTVASLAGHWECSEGVIRKLIASGQLQCFRVGALIRIRSEEVERFECSKSTQSSASEMGSPLSGEMPQESGTGTPYPRPIGLERKRKPANAGGSAIVHHGPWAA